MKRRPLRCNISTANMAREDDDDYDNNNNINNNTNNNNMYVCIVINILAFATNKNFT
jgi:hypothetical protein